MWGQDRWILAIGTRPISGRLIEWLSGYFSCGSRRVVPSGQDNSTLPAQAVFTSPPFRIPGLTRRHFRGFLTAINNALRYHTIVTSRRIACVIGFIWTLSLLVAVFPFLGWREVRPRVSGGYCQYHLNLAPSYILFLHVTVCLTPLTTTCLAYCKVFQVARLQAQKIASMTVRLSFVG